MLLIKTNNLQLRLVEESDLKAIHELLIQPETDRFNTLGLPEGIDATKLILDEWISQVQREEVENYTFVIEESKGANFVGLFGLNLGKKVFKNAEVWYKIHPGYWHKGIATESLIGVLNFCFKKLKLHRIEAGCAVANIASFKVMEKAGMSREGRLRKILPLEDGWTDTFIYAILESDELRRSE